MVVVWMVHVEQFIWNGGGVWNVYRLHYPFHIVHMHSIWNNLGRVNTIKFWSPHIFSFTNEVLISTATFQALHNFAFPRVKL